MSPKLYRIVAVAALLSLVPCAHASKEWNAQTYAKNSASQSDAAHHLLKRFNATGSEESAIDIGSGDGKITSEIAEKWLKHAQVVGIDKSESMVKFAEENFGGGKVNNLRFEQHDALKLPFKQEFDVAFSFSAMHWVKPQDKALQRIEQALKPGGRLFVSMPIGYPRALEKAIKDVTTKKEWRVHFKDFRLPQVFFEPKPYEAMLRAAGFVNATAERVEMFELFPSVAAFRGFIAQWLPHLQPIPAPRRAAFLDALMVYYVRYEPKGKDGAVMFKKHYLEATAEKTGAAKAENL